VSPARPARSPLMGFPAPWLAVRWRIYRALDSSKQRALVVWPKHILQCFRPQRFPGHGPVRAWERGHRGHEGDEARLLGVQSGHVVSWRSGRRGSGCQHLSCQIHVFSRRQQASQCYCIPGWWGIAHYHETASCKMCKEDTFCPSGRIQYPCPANSGSPDEANYCTCDPGYWGATHDDCMLCSANYYCPGGHPQGEHLASTTQFACPANSNSPAGSDDGTDCQCNPGYSEPVASPDPGLGPSCVICAENSYCPGGATKADCMANSWAPIGQDEALDCTCNAAFFGNSVYGCATCHANYYCTGGVSQTKCPANSGSSTVVRRSTTAPAIWAIRLP